MGARQWHTARGRWLAPATALAVLALAGCSTGGFNGIYNLPLPGGAGLGSHPYQVTAQFANVGDLVPQSAVRVNDVAVGRVTKIWLPPNGWTANVTMLVNGKVRLPANAIAQVEQSSLLGEQFVALSAQPGVAPSGTLANDAVIPVSRTTSNATVEQVLGALSLLLNGGGIDQLHTIVSQLNDAFAGNEPQIRSLLARIRSLLANLNSHRDDIITALTGLRDLSATLAARNRQISHTLDHLTPGLRVLADQRAQLVTMLKSLHSLSGVAVATIGQPQRAHPADRDAAVGHVGIREDPAGAGQLQPHHVIPAQSQIAAKVRVVDAGVGDDGHADRRENGQLEAVRTGEHQCLPRWW